jgi:hypothetical protein
MYIASLVVILVYLQSTKLPVRVCLLVAPEDENLFHNLWRISLLVEEELALLHRLCPKDLVNINSQ